MSSPDAAALALFDNQKYANLTTFRRDGREVTTPMWFARVGDVLYIRSALQTGKVKRLRNNPAARLGPSDRRGQPIGPQIAMTGRQLSGAESAAAEQALNTKYGFVTKVVELMFRLRGTQKVFFAFRLA